MSQCNAHTSNSQGAKYRLGFILNECPQQTSYFEIAGSRMYRQNSFSAKSFVGSPGEAEDGPDEDHVVYLKTSGKFFNKNNPLLEGGLVTSFKNHSMRNKTWPISTVCCNPKSGAFAIADERGQVYKMSVAHNTYDSIRLASTGVSAMCFISQHKNHLVVAYESGSIVVLDAHTKDIIGNLQVKNKSVARIIQSHPTQLKVAIASDDKTLAVWDLNTCQCVQSMQCEEAIVDVRYELNGQIIVVVLEHTGAYMYATDPTSELRMHLKLPPSEPAPKWTAYCAYNVFLDTQGLVSKQKLASEPVALNVLLASSTSMIYSWHVSVADLLNLDEKPGGWERDKKKEASMFPPSHLVGVIELPLKNRVAVAMQLLNPNSTNSGTLAGSNTPTNSNSSVHNLHSLAVNASFSAGAGGLGGALSAQVDLPPRLLVLTQQGGMLVIDVEGFQLRSVGFYTIKADLDANLLHGPNATSETGWQAQTVGSRKSNPATSNNNGDSTSLTASHKSAYGRVHSSKNFFVVVGCDGVARLFDVRGALGTGSLCGTVLRSRIPRSSGAANVQQSAVHLRSINTATTNYPHTTNNGGHPHTHPSAAVSGSALRVQQVSHFMAHPAERRASLGSPSHAQASQAHMHNSSMHSESNDASFAYDFIIHDSTDEHDAHSKRKPGFRSTSVGRGAGGEGSVTGQRGGFGSSTAKTSTGYGSNTRAASVASRATRSVSGASDRSGISKGRVLQSFVATHKSRKTEADTANLPLFELAALTPKESQVNARKLRNFLELNGEFPARYRPLVWRFLLKLPENTTAFSALVNRGVHSGFDNLYDLYPIQNRKVFDRLQNLCSQMAHWAPILADAPYLPALVFPFTLVYNTDELAALETCMSIMMWWGHSWHATHPNPPVHIIDALDTLLKYQDSKLHAHLKAIKVAPGVLGWAMMSNLFTEVLSRTNWLKLMDTLICHFDQISIILLAPVAIMKELKSVLLTCDTAAQATLLLRSQQNMNMATVIRVMLEWLRHTPPKYFSSVATRHLDGKRLELGPGHTTEELKLSEVDEAGENLSLSFGRPIFPLTKARYPVYDGFPAQVLDLQIRERNKILALSKEVMRRESVLGALQQKLAEVENDHMGWMNKHKSASDAEQKHQTEMMIREREHLAELQRLEEEISRQRLATLTSLETAAKDEMELMDKAARESQQLLVEGEAHMKEKMNIQLSLQKHRELAELAEVATHERIRQLQMRRIREDWVKNVSESVKSREEEFTVRDAILAEQWKKEDDRQHLLREQRTRELKAMEEDTRMAALQEDLTLRMQRLQLERDAKVVEIERVRAMRLAKEQAEEALEAAERSSIVLRKHEILQNTEQSALLSEATVRQAESKLMETVNLIQNEATKLLDAEKVHTLRQNKARMQARQAQLKQEWAEKSGQQLQGVISAQGELQAQMLKLQQAALRSELDRDLAYTTITASGQFEEAKRQIESLEDNVLVQQRQRFEEIQEYMRAQHIAATQQSGVQQQPQHSSGGPRGVPGSPEDEPQWDRPPSAIPAPLSGAGIGYGVRPPAPPAGGSAGHVKVAAHSPVQQEFKRRNLQEAEDLSDIEQDATQFKLPLDKALKVASAALKAHDSLFDEDDYYSDEYDNERVRRPGNMNTATAGSTWNAGATALRRHDMPPSDFSTGGVSGRSLQQDALDIATANEAYSLRESRGKTTATTATSTNYSATSRGTATGPGAMKFPNLNAEGLRHLADQSLKNLQATRVMNRDEVAQEKQEHQIYQSPGSTPGTVGTTAAATHAQGAAARNTPPSAQPSQASGRPAPVMTAQPSVANPARYAQSHLMSDGASSTPSTTPSSPSRRVGTIVDSDTALWAMENASDDDLSV